MVKVTVWAPAVNGMDTPLAGRTCPPISMSALRAAPISIRASELLGPVLGERVLARVTSSRPLPLARVVTMMGGRGLHVCPVGGLLGAALVVVQGGVPQRGQVGQLRLHWRWLWLLGGQQPQADWQQAASPLQKSGQHAPELLQVCRHCWRGASQAALAMPR